MGSKIILIKHFYKSRHTSRKNSISASKGDGSKTVDTVIINHLDPNSYKALVLLVYSAVKKRATKIQNHSISHILIHVNTKFEGVHTKFESRIIFIELNFTTKQNTRNFAK